MKRLVCLAVLGINLSLACAADCKSNPTRWVDQECAKQAVETTSKEIEQAMAALVLDADDVRRPLLLDAQNAWLAYRERQCRLYFDVTRRKNTKDYGTMSEDRQRLCQIQLNDQRIVELRGLYSLTH